MADWDDFSEAAQEPEESTDADDVEGSPGEPADPTAELKAEVEKLRGEVAGRLKALDEKTAATKENVNMLLGGIAAVMALGVLLAIGFAFDKPDPSDNRIAEYSDSELLRKGPHCYKERAEMLANRQRALEAVDRLTWQRDNPIPQPDDGRSYATPLASALPYVREIGANARAEDEKNSDPELCFYVQRGVG